MVDHKTSIQALIDLAKAALGAATTTDLEAFVAQTDNYLLQFEAWQQQIAGGNPLVEGSNEAAKNELRTLLQSLNESHQQLMKVAESAREQVGAEMRDLHKRASGMKKYLDVLPPCVSITGKRKG